MPQLKKLTIQPSNILPKMELNQTFSCVNESMYSTAYLSFLIDEDKSQSFLSEPESDVSDSVQNRPRKRQRLDHLSQEEKVMRRKLKNRVAAQTARDRKKAKMQELEEQVSRLLTEKRILFLKSIESVKRIQALEEENSELKARLGLTTSDNLKKVKEESEEESSSVSDDSRSLEQAAGTGSADCDTVDDAVRILTNDSETDDLLDLLQQYGHDLMQCDYISTYTDGDETKQQNQLAPEMVGPTSKSLESNKELIHFDHIYSKQEDVIISTTDDTTLCLPQLPVSDLSTKAPITLLQDTTPATDIPVISIPSEDTSDLDLPFPCESFSLDEINEHLLSVVPSETAHCSSPSASSDAGYDSSSSFSVSSPRWDDTLTELFPTLV